MLDGKFTQHNRRHTRQNQRFEFFLVIYSQARCINDIDLPS
nr:MAG TPA: hypothetical protein [Caudoviricetes sp.]